MSVGSDLLSLLYWCMLAANTVGPGTVIVCARAGAEYQLELVWALVFASFLAFTLQEGGARLTIVSGKTLGQCLREKLGVSMTGTAPKACWAFAGAVYCGNLLYECNNFAGGIDAVFSFPGIDDLPATAVRIVSCFLYAIVVLAILYVNKVEAIGESLGVLMMAMVGLFLAVAITVGFSMAELLLGLLPKLPEKSTLPNSTAPCDMVLSLVGTTAIGFNIFLGGSMAIGKSLATCRRGIEPLPETNSLPEVAAQVARPTWADDTVYLAGALLERHLIWSVLP
ncbi:unnamed protein product [Effrenium voratum]|nr:unnamed protein product [Effrenium voratum]